MKPNPEHLWLLLGNEKARDESKGQKGETPRTTRLAIYTNICAGYQFLPLVRKNGKHQKSQTIWVDQLP